MRVAVASRGTIKLIDADTGRVALKINANDAPVNSVAFSPDGRRILSASSDGTAKEWLAYPVE